MDVKESSRITVRTRNARNKGRKYRHCTKSIRQKRGRKGHGYGPARTGTELFLDEDYRVEESLLCGFYFIRELFDKCGQDAKLSELAEAYFSTDNQQQLRRAIEEIERDPFATMEERNELLQDLAVNYRKEGLYRNYLNPVIEKAEELSGLFENIGNPADAAEQNADLKTEMADSMHAVESEFQAYNPLMRKFLINEFNADLLMPDGDLEMTGLKSLRQF